MRTRPATRGLTLVERMVVVAILGLLASVIGVAVFHHMQTARLDTARIACNQLREAAQRQFVQHPEDTECPTRGHAVRQLS